MTGHVENEPCDRRHNNCDPDQVVDAEELTVRYVRVLLYIAAERCCIGYDKSDTIDDLHHCQCGDERRNV